MATRRARRALLAAFAFATWLSATQGHAATPGAANEGTQIAVAPSSPSHAPIRLTFAELIACPLSAPTAAEPRETWERSLSAPIRAAVEQRVVLTGYMLPTATEQGRTRQFLLMRNQNACCFGQMPSAAEYIIAECPAPGVAVTMDVPVTITGRLRIAPLQVGGTLVQFYTLSDAALAP